MGLSQTLMENMEFINGQTFQTNLIFYKIPAALDIPDMDSICVTLPGAYQAAF